MSEGRREHGYMGRAAARLLAGASALLVATAMLGVAPLAAEDPPETTTVPANDPVGAAAEGPVQVAQAVPGFTKVFVPDVIEPGGVSTLTFTILNVANTDPTPDDLAFTDNLPSGVTVVAPDPNTTNGCPGGTVTAVPGSAVISYENGHVVGGDNCVISVNVTASEPGTYPNTTALTSVSGAFSVPASDTLTVEGPPAFSKAFVPDVIAPDGVSTLTFTIGNAVNSTNTTNLDFTDPLPEGVEVAADPNTTNGCTGGTVTAVPGSASISYTGGTALANDNCVISVNVTASTRGTYENTAGPLTSSKGDSGTATDTLTVGDPLVLTKTFVEGSIVSGGTATFSITVRNDGTEVLNDVALTDALAPGCNTTFATLAVDASETYTCTLANVTANFTNTIVATATGADSGLTVTAEASAAVTVTAAVPAALAGPALALTGGSTGPLAGVGFGILLFGALLLYASRRSRLAQG